MTGGKGLCRGFGEVQKLQSFRDVRGRFSDGRPDFLDVVRAAFAVEQRAKALRLLEGVHVDSLDVFNDLKLLGLGVRERQDANGEFRKPGALRGAVTPRPGHDFKMAVHAPDHERREHAVTLNACREFVEAFFVKRLAGVGVDSVNSVSETF